MEQYPYQHAHPLKADERIRMYKTQMILKTMVRSKKAKTVGGDLPHDIIFFNILSRLPVKALLRFSCVSKLWYATISSQEFAKSHWTCGRSSNFGLLKFQYRGSKQWSYACDYIFINKEPGRGNDQYFRFQTSKWTCRVGECNGLFCIRSKSGIEICNPSTREFLYHRLPPRPSPGCLISYGFGFDSFKNEYKVVQVVSGNGNFRRCMVCTFGTNLWRDITNESDLSLFLDDEWFKGASRCKGFLNSNTALYSNGALYWYFPPTYATLSFCLRNERFSAFQAPFPGQPYAHHYIHARPFITEWQGFYCLAFPDLFECSVYLFSYNPEKEKCWSLRIVNFDNFLRKPSTIGFSGKSFYWFNEGYLSLYSQNSKYPQNSKYSWCKTIIKFDSPVLSMDLPFLKGYGFFFQRENLLSLKSLVTSRPNHAACINNKSLVQVKLVSSL